MTKQQQTIELIIQTPDNCQEKVIHLIPAIGCEIPEDSIDIYGSKYAEVYRKALNLSNNFAELFNLLCKCEGLPKATNFVPIFCKFPGHIIQLEEFDIES